MLYFSLSKNISGNYNSARIAAEDLMESGNYTRKIRMIDSLNASLAQGILAIYASEMREKGIAFDEVADILETCPAKMNGVFTVGDLKYLARTGRLSGTAAVIGNVLSINRFSVETKTATSFSTKNAAAANPRFTNWSPWSATTS